MKRYILIYKKIFENKINVETIRSFYLKNIYIQNGPYYNSYVLLMTIV